MLVVDSDSIGVQQSARISTGPAIAILTERCSIRPAANSSNNTPPHGRCLAAPPHIAED